MIIMHIDTNVFKYTLKIRYNYILFYGVSRTERTTVGITSHPVPVVY